MSRVQKAPGVWVDEEPREAHLAHGGSISGRVIPDMRPIITMGGLKDMSRPSGSKARRAFSIHPENRRCPFIMRKIKQRCALLATKHSEHRSEAAVAAEWARAHRRAA